MKALVLFSGGVDSTTCLAIAADKYGADEVLALSLYYGQKHSRELEAARKIAAHYGVKHKELDLARYLRTATALCLKGSQMRYPQGVLCGTAEKDRRQACLHICSVQKRTFPCFCGKHSPVKRLRGDILRRSQR